MKISSKLNFHIKYSKNSLFLIALSLLFFALIVFLISILKNKLDLKEADKENIESFYKSFVKNNPTNPRHYQLLSQFYENDGNDILSTQMQNQSDYLIKSREEDINIKMSKITENYDESKNDIYNLFEDTILNRYYIRFYPINLENDEMMFLHSAFGNRRYEILLEYADNYIKNNKASNSDAFLFKADTHYILGQYEAAEAIYKSILEDEKIHEDLLKKQIEYQDLSEEQKQNNIKLFYSNYKLGNIAYKNKDYLKAEEYYKNAIEYSKDNAIGYADNNFIYFNLAKTLNKLGKGNEALQLFATVIQYYKNRDTSIIYHSYIESAAIYLSLSAYSQAIASYLQAADIKEDEKIFYSIALLCEILKDKYNAKLYYRKAIAANEEQYLYHYNLAKIYHNESNYISSIQYLNNAINFNESNINLYFLLSDNYVKIGNYTRATEALSNAIENGINNDAVYAKIALILHNHQNQTLSAIEALEKSIEINPFSVTNYTMLSNMYLNIGNTNEAINIHNQYLSIYSNSLSMNNRLKQK